MFNFQLVSRDGKTTRNESFENTITYAELRDLLQKTGEMDRGDRFESVGRGANWELSEHTQIEASNEKGAIESGATVGVIAVRSAIPVVDGSGKTHTLYFSSSDTIADLRQANTAVLKESELQGDGKTIDRADEDRTMVRLFNALQVQAPAKPVLKLLLIIDKAPPKPLDWPQGSLKLPLADLRTFLKTKLGDDAPTGLFVSGTAGVPDEMEQFEPVSKLGALDDFEQLRVSFQPRRRGAATAPSTPSSDQPGSKPGSATPPAAGGNGDIPSLIETIDLLGKQFGVPAAKPGAPQDVMDAMEPERRSQLICAMGVLHGVRFVRITGDDYELDRAFSPALDLDKHSAFVRVARPPVSTRFSASASDNRTAESIKSAMSWNVGGSVGVETPKASLQVSSKYSQDKDEDKVTAGSTLRLRLEYLVARAEVVLDPNAIRLSSDLEDDVNALLKAPEKNQQQLLADLLDRFGTHVALRNVIGGKLIYRQDRECKEGNSRQQLVREFSSDVQGSYQAVTASARGGFKSTDEKANAYVSHGQTVEVSAAGGDPALAMDPYSWAATLSHAGWWTAIAVGDVIPILVLFPEDKLIKLVNILSKQPLVPPNMAIDWPKYVSQVKAVRMRRAPIDQLQPASKDPPPASGAPVLTGLS